MAWSANQSSWKTYDNTDSNITVLGTDWDIKQDICSWTTFSQYNTTLTALKNVQNDGSNKIQFNFVGTKIRLIGYKYTDHSTKVRVVIDGNEEYYNEYSSSLVSMNILYEKNNLENRQHSVEIVSINTGRFSLDAIDIDENGRLLSYNPRPYKYLLKNTTNDLLTINDNHLDSYTKLMLHMNEDTFKDECGHTVTNNGVIIDTSNKKFGDGSGCFDGNSYLSITYGSDFNFGNSDFTIDMQIKRNTLNSYQRFFGQASAIIFSSSNSPICIRFNDDNKIMCYLGFSDGTYKTLVSNYIFNDTTNFHHISIIRNNGTLYLAIDGIIDNTDNTLSTKSLTTLTIPFTIGKVFEETEYFNGNIDEFRVSKGIARWTSNFTLPTREDSSEFIDNLGQQTPTSELFQEQGFDDITLLNTTTFDETKTMVNEGVVGTGNMYSVGIDCSMIKNVNIK
jgi:hypothetical protein